MSADPTLTYQLDPTTYTPATCAPVEVTTAARAAGLRPCPH